MKWLLGVFSQGWNRARGRQGHVFQGRYKSVPVNGSDADSHYFRIVADYIHLNPARAGLAGGKLDKLSGYRWSSLSCYAKGKGPPWLEMERVLKSFNLAESGRGRRAYVEWLEARALNDDGAIDAKAQDALRRGWYLGEETFRDRLLDLVDKVKGVKARKHSKSECVRKDHGEKDAERLVQACATDLGLPTGVAELARLRKGDECKAILATLLRRRTAVGFEWIATRLHMGHSASVSRLVCGVKRDKKLEKKVNELDQLFQGAD